jgi:hypothetical protein
MGWPEVTVELTLKLAEALERIATEQKLTATDVAEGPVRGLTYDAGLRAAGSELVAGTSVTSASSRIPHGRRPKQAFSGAVGCGSRRAGRTTRIPTTPRPHLSQLS